MGDYVEMPRGTNEKRAKREKRKIADYAITIFLLAFLMILVGQTAGSLIYLIPFMRTTDIGLTLGIYLIFIGIWAVAVPYLYFTRKNRPILQVLGKKPAGNRLKYLLLGTLAGFLLNGACVLVAWLHGNIVLIYDSFQPGYLLLLYTAVFIQSAAEEFLCRGFIYQRLLKSYGKPCVAIIGNSLLFGVFHLTNDGVTVLSMLNIVLVGIMLTFIVRYMDSLWCAMALHAAWNFTQNIIFGLPNSGIVALYSLFRLEASTARNSLVSNVGFGVESALPATILVAVACVAIYFCFGNGREAGRTYQVWENPDS